MMIMAMKSTAHINHEFTRRTMRNAWMWVSKHTKHL